MKLHIEIESYDGLTEADKAILRALAETPSPRLPEKTNGLKANPDTQDAAAERADDPTFRNTRVEPKDNPNAVTEPWDAPQPPAPAEPPAAAEEKPRRKRRTKAQIEEDNAREAAEKEAVLSREEGRTPEAPQTLTAQAPTAPPGFYYAGPDPAGQPRFLPEAQPVTQAATPPAAPAGPQPGQIIVSYDPMNGHPVYGWPTQGPVAQAPITGQTGQNFDAPPWG